MLILRYNLSCKGIEDYFSNCDPHTSSVRVNWEFVRNALSWSPHSTATKSETLWMVSINLFLISLPGDSDAHKSLKTINLERVKMSLWYSTYNKRDTKKKWKRNCVRKGKRIDARQTVKRSHKRQE